MVDEKISTSYKSESELTDMRVKFNHYAMENEQLKRRVNDMRELSVRLEEYEVKFMGVTHEVGRLNNEIEQKIIELRHTHSEL